MTVVGKIPGCAHCDGLAKVEVRTAEGPVGYLVSEYPWDLEIPDDPAEHPATPHYARSWLAYSLNGELLNSNVATLYFGGLWLAERARKS